MESKFRIDNEIDTKETVWNIVKDSRLMTFRNDLAKKYKIDILH